MKKILTNRNGMKLIDFVLCNKLKIIVTYIPGQPEPNDYIICNEKLADTVHYLLVDPISMKLGWYRKKCKSHNTGLLFKVSLLQDPNT